MLKVSSLEFLLLIWFKGAWALQYLGHKKHCVTLALFTAYNFLHQFWSCVSTIITQSTTKLEPILSKRAFIFNLVLVLLRTSV